jgi:hypothetical protein
MEELPSGKAAARKERKRVDLAPDLVSTNLPEDELDSNLSVRHTLHSFIDHCNTIIIPKERSLRWLSLPPPLHVRIKFEISIHPIISFCRFSQSKPLPHAKKWH